MCLANERWTVSFPLLFSPTFCLPACTFYITVKEKRIDKKINLCYSGLCLDLGRKKLNISHQTSSIYSGFCLAVCAFMCKPGNVEMWGDISSCKSLYQWDHPADTVVEQSSPKIVRRSRFMLVEKGETGLLGPKACGTASDAAILALFNRE